MEKALREAKRNTNWVEQNHDWEAAVKRFVRAAVLRPGVPGRLRAVRGPGGGARRPGGARTARAQADRARVPRHLPGRRAPVPRPGRPRQPPAGRLRLPPGDAPPADGRLAAGARRPSKLFVTLRLLGLRARRPAPFAGGYEPRRRRRRTRARSCAAARCWSSSPCANAPFGGTLDRPARRALARRAARRASARSTPANRSPRLVGEHGVAVFERLLATPAAPFAPSVEFAEQIVEIEVWAEPAGDWPSLSRGHCSGGRSHISSSVLPSGSIM